MNSNLCVGRKQNFPKKVDVKNIHFFFISNLWWKLDFFNTRSWSDKLSFETLFVENSRELFEIFDFSYHLGSKFRHLLVSLCVESPSSSAAEMVAPRGRTTTKDASVKDVSKRVKHSCFGLNCVNLLV